MGFGLFTLIMGMIQPWWVLWWTSKQNRILVLKYYGLPLLFLVVLYISLKLMSIF